ncbi:MAG: U32 family peptidase, partial [Lachnospiraceae bacterium]|nr:U32 family peptidase [Lachnospiraceae bacterium]
MRDPNRKIELLAPAGSYDALCAVIEAGCDAVYIGGTRFGARAYANNPEEELLLKGIDHAHMRGVKVYMTVNTLLKQTEIEELCDYLLPYYEAGLDAVIVQDFGVMRTIAEHFPMLPIHVSTQMTIADADAAKLLPEQVTRIVPARELSLAEIETMACGTERELEIFVHGALCYCYSGQCLLSSMVGGRSGNRGRCAQPCR